MRSTFSHYFKDSKNLLFFLLFLGIISCNLIPEQKYDADIPQGFLEKSTVVNDGLVSYFADTLKAEKGQNISIASWNIQHLGRTKTSEDIFEIANTLRDFDLVAIQEVVAKDPAGAQAVARIADELNRMGSKWDYQVSDPTKSPSVQMSERYAFLWKTSKISIVHRAFFDKDLEDLCFREPFIAAFKAKRDSELFYLVNYHSRKYTDNPEIRFVDSELSLINALKTYIPDIIITDFNLVGMDAFDIIRIVNEYNKKIPVVVITGHLKNEADRDRLLEEGAYGFFLKEPINTLNKRLLPLFVSILKSNQEDMDQLGRERRRYEDSKSHSDFLRAHDYADDVKTEIAPPLSLWQGFMKLFKSKTAS